MKIVPMEQVLAGARLARDLRDASDRLVLARGTQLTSPLLARLQAAGVTDLPLAPSAEELALELQRQIRALDERFAGHEASASMMTIRDAVCDYWSSLQRE